MDYQIIVVMAALGLTALSADARANSIFDRQTSRADEVCVEKTLVLSAHHLVTPHLCLNS